MLPLTGLWKNWLQVQVACILVIDYFVQDVNKVFLFCSLTVHPNKLLVATGQAAGHDRREGRVSGS
jgi:hypothetical protein